VPHTDHGLVGVQRDDLRKAYRIASSAYFRVMIQGRNIQETCGDGGKYEGDDKVEKSRVAIDLRGKNEYC
jgi:hypothetical protein